MRRIAVLQTVLHILGAINGAAIQGQQSGEGTVMDWTHIPSALTEWTHVCSAEWTRGVRGRESRRRFIHGVHRGVPVGPRG
jgi:hypothetical protein